jgi:hypothetical protein
LIVVPSHTGGAEIGDVDTSETIPISTSWAGEKWDLAAVATVVE